MLVNQSVTYVYELDQVKLPQSPQRTQRGGYIFIRRMPSTKRFTLKLISNPLAQVP